MYSNEAELQQIVCDKPELLKHGQHSADIFFIDREVTVPSGRIDILAFDKNGTVFIIEAKLNRNMQSRREVLGQLFDYFSDIHGLSYFEFNSLTNRKLENIIKEGKFEESIRENIENNLKNNGVKLFIVVDESNDNLEKILASIKDFIKIDIEVIVIQKDNDGKLRSFRVGKIRINPKPSGGNRSHKLIRSPNSDRNFEELAEVEEYWNRNYPHKTTNNQRGIKHHYHQIFFWGKFPHYEFLDYSTLTSHTNQIGVEFHIEAAKKKYPKLFQELQQFQQINLPKEIEFRTNFSGSLRILFSYGTPKETICASMDKLIKLTKDFIGKKMM